MSSCWASRWRAGTSSSAIVPRSSRGTAWLSTITRPKGGTPITVSPPRPGRTTTSIRAGPTRPPVWTNGMTATATTPTAAAAPAPRRHRRLTAADALQSWLVFRPTGPAHRPFSLPDRARVETGGAVTII